MRFRRPSKVIGLDIGSHSVKAVQAVRSGRSMTIEQEGIAIIDRNLLNSDPVAATSRAIRSCINGFAIDKSMFVGALPGQSVVIRYPRLRDVPINELDEAVEQEASQSIPYDLSEVFLDWSLLSEEPEGDTQQQKILLVAAKHDVIDKRIQYADVAEIEYSILSVDSLALADAAEECKFFNQNESVALINLGASSVSIHFTKDGESNFIRDISWGAKELIQAIGKAKRLDYEDAEACLMEEGAGLSAGGDDTGNVVDVQVIDEPKAVVDDDDLGLESAAPMAAASSAMSAAPQEITLADNLSAPIARLVTEVRRSFDYYEHQLYEHPVERIILSGGISHIPMIREALSEELGVDQILIADPSAGGISISGKVNMNRGDVHPAQYMVAVGLAARGLSEL
ncbi:MAG TPA: type IV pilus assembly protein PilM [Candidatus Hydrogenedentes bacterium]|nr:type IV pilus assembly protein PilM [Candidatus Hydrogenedentota bacterium]